MQTDLHSSLLFLMIKLEEAKSEQMADKNFVAALTEVLRYFRDNGELKKAYDLQKDSLTDIANSPWVKLVMGMLTSKMQEDKVDAELPNIDALIEENTSDDFIEKKINDVLGDDVELKEEQRMKEKELLNVKLRVNMLILEIESALNISDSKFINAEHVLSQLRIIKQELEQ